VDAFIAISQAVKTAMVKAGVQADKIEVVYSGVPAPQVKRPRNWRRERGWPATAIICGIVGAMTQEKGLAAVSPPIPAPAMMMERERAMRRVP